MKRVSRDTFYKEIEKCWEVTLPADNKNISGSNSRENKRKQERRKE